jgi:hypothetical protein
MPECQSWFAAFEEVARPQEMVWSEIVGLARRLLNFVETIQLDRHLLKHCPNPPPGLATCWDSVSHITLVAAIEQRFGVRFNTTEIEELRNFGDLAQLIGQNTAKTG